jgi:hypothetical protein
MIGRERRNFDGATVPQSSCPGFDPAIHVLAPDER